MMMIKTDRINANKNDEVLKQNKRDPNNESLCSDLYIRINI